MGFSLGKFSHLCAVLTYILTLHCAVANFEYNDVFEDEIIKHDKRQNIVGAQTAIPQDKIRDEHPDLVEGIKKAEELNQDLVFDWSSLQVTIQVVQGKLYRVKVDVQPKSCSGSPNCNVKHCSFEIWSRVWLSGDEKLKIGHFDCTDA